MPCSCRNKAATHIYSSSSQAHKKVLLTLTIILSVQQVEILSNSLSVQQYDFSSNVLPDELCVNCTVKHLSYAYTLLLVDRTLNRLTACGLLLCAGDHLRYTDINLSNKCCNMAYKILAGEDVKQLIALWIKHIVLNGFTSSAVEILYIMPSLLLRALFNLCHAFSLIFTLISYLKINIPYAVGYMVDAAHKFTLPSVKMDKEATRLRELWKLIQDIEPYNDTYYKCRKLLPLFILLIYNTLKQSQAAVN